MLNLDLNMSEVEMNFPKGISVSVTFTDGSCSQYSDVTEVHHKFNGSNHIAIESDMRSQGLTIELSRILSVTIG